MKIYKSMLGLNIWTKQKFNLPHNKQKLIIKDITTSLWKKYSRIINTHTIIKVRWRVGKDLNRTILSLQQNMNHWQKIKGVSL